MDYQEAKKNPQPVWTATDGSEIRPYDKVLARDDDSEEWRPYIMSHADETCAEGKYHTTGDIAYRQCIPYEGNEFMLGTTYVPEKKRWKPKMDELYYFVGFNVCFCVAFVQRMKWNGTSECEDQYGNRNVYQTREEARKVADALSKAWKEITKSE